MTDLPEFHDTPEGRVCQRCGKEEGVEKRANREWLCKGCWAALTAGDILPPRDVWMESKE